jgi:transposase
VGFLGLLRRCERAPASATTSSSRSKHHIPARLPEVVGACVAALGSQLRAVKAQILAFDRRIMPGHRSNETSTQLDVIPGIGPALATALVASVLIPERLDRGETSRRGSGSFRGRTRAEATKQGGRYLRSLFTVGALAVIRYAKLHGDKHLLRLRGIVGAAAHQGRRRCARQQDCSNRLGNDGQG